MIYLDQCARLDVFNAQEGLVKNGLPHRHHGQTVKEVEAEDSAPDRISLSEGAISLLPVVTPLRMLVTGKVK